MRSNKLLSLVLILFLCISCKTELTKIVTKFDNGNIKRIYYIDKDSLKQGETIAYHESGRISFKTKYTNSDLRDSVYYYRDNPKNDLEMVKLFHDNGYTSYKDFHENSSLKKEGMADNNDRKIYTWTHYDKQGNKEKIAEYKIIKGKQYTNQLWYLLPSGDTLNTGISMKHEITPKKLQLGDSIRLFFQSDVAQFGDTSDFTVTIPKDYTKQNFTPDFSNTEDEYRKPGKYSKHIYSLKYDNTYPTEKETIDTTDHYKTVVFYIKPKRVGKDTIRGYFREWHSAVAGLPNLWWRYNRKDIKTMNLSDEGTYDTEEISIFFDIPIEVYE
ncbi:hypothetical protein [Aquimarina sp. I32.4]|uniref:hypothetical protein n=1 Tax=Aquimarina sp. I32.4 TaxID=2053903 RepID=UPI000CDE655D|nr:hypothetical protein [Aquimarina sp. I32.4]